MATRLVPGGAMFFETSAKTSDNLSNIFEQPVRNVLEKKGLKSFVPGRNIIKLAEHQVDEGKKTRRSKCCHSTT